MPPAASKQSLFERLTGSKSLALLFGHSYWEAIYQQNGSDGQVLKNIIVSEHTGMGVVAALVATIAVSCLLVAPTSYNEDNELSDVAQCIFIVLLSISLVACVSCIVTSFEIYAQTLKVPPAKMLRWVETLKGNMRFECILHMHWALISLMGAVITLVYLLYGGRLFVISICIVGSGMILVNLNMSGVHARLMSGILFEDEQQVDGGDGAAVDGGYPQGKGSLSRAQGQEQGRTKASAVVPIDE